MKYPDDFFGFFFFDLKQLKHEANFLLIKRVLQQTHKTMKPIIPKIIYGFNLKHGYSKNMTKLRKLLTISVGRREKERVLRI